MPVGIMRLAVVDDKYLPGIYVILIVSKIIYH
jgi:hypothetical protein